MISRYATATWWKSFAPCVAHSVRATRNWGTPSASKCGQLKVSVPSKYNRGDGVQNWWRFHCAPFSFSICNNKTINDNNVNNKAVEWKLWRHMYITHTCRYLICMRCWKISKNYGQALLSLYHIVVVVVHSKLCDKCHALCLKCYRFCCCCFRCNYLARCQRKPHATAK